VRLSEKPVHSIPSACHGWAETVAASRFLDNPAIGEQEMLSGHQHATLERIRAQEVVLLGQDTTFLNYGTTPQKPGMGTVKGKSREEYLLHPTVALTPDRVNLGVLGAKWWQRPEPPGGQERNRKPIAEQESSRWLEGYQLACEGQQRCPDTLVVNVADREGDIHEWFLDAMRRLPEERAEFIIRAKCNRRLATGTEPCYLWEAMQKARAAGRITVELTRQPDRQPRPVTLRVVVKRVTFHGARRPGGRRPPVEVVAVYAKECRPPSSEEPIAWLLLTSLPVVDCPRACLGRQWYQCRWEIELFCRVLTHGGQIER
jgi:Transposase DNA-binding